MRCPLFLALVLSTIPLCAQQTPGGAVRPTGQTDGNLHPDKLRVVEEVTRKRDDMRGGRVDRFNVRVRVKLRNGAKLSGVVKNGRLVEREAGIDFVEADRASPDAGIRLYYFDETTSFVFLRWAEIESHKVLVKMTDDEVRALERELLERERKRNEERQKLASAQSRNAPVPPEGAEDKAKDPAAQDKDKDKDKAGKAKEAADPTPLLTEFPVAQGWSQQRYEEIQRRKVTVGAFPNEKERRFLDVFEEWKKQHAQSQGQAAKPPVPAPAGNGK